MANTLEITPEGACMLAGYLLHPAQEPLEAAREELARLLSDAQPADVLVIAGGGLGWHALAALEADPAPKVVVFEPDPRRLEMMRALGPRLEGAVVADSAERLAEVLGKMLVYGQPGRVAVFSPFAYTMAEPQLEETARRVLKRVLTRRRADKATRVSRLGQWRANLEENFPWLLKLPDITQLENVFYKVPAVIVGAGPSLDSSLKDLGLARDRTLVIAAASALRPMDAAGMRPHVAVALEAKDESRQFAGVDHSEVLFVAASSSHPNHFLRWQGPRALMHLEGWVAGLSGMGRMLPTGGHATSAAFSLAVLWGCEPIVLVGQDLAYTGGRVHATGRAGAEEDVVAAGVMVPAIGGGEVATSSVMLSYLEWYREAMAYLGRLNSPPRVLNATAAGAQIPGMKHVQLPEVLQELEGLDFDFSEVIAALERLPRPTPQRLASALAEQRLVVRRCLRALAEGGLEAAIAEAPEHSAAAEALMALAPGSDIAQAMEALEQTYWHLIRLEERIHA